MSQHLFPRHPVHQPTESLLGYILRLTEQNGYKSPGDILYHAGLRRAVTADTFKLTEIAGRIGRTRLDMLPIGYYSTGQKGSRRCLLGHSLRLNDLSLRKPKLCPD